MFIMPYSIAVQEQDRRFLEILAEQEERDLDVLTTRREKSCADATWMKQVREGGVRRRSDLFRFR